MWDSAVHAAIEGKLGTGFEDSPGRLQELDVLTVNHARSLKGISACQNLKILVLAGCELASLEELSSMASLRLVSLADSALGSLDAISELDVHTVHIERSGVTDVSPLLRCPGLVEVKLAGSDLPDNAYDEVIPELQKSGCYVTFPDEVERELTSLLRRSGMSVNCYKRGAEYRLCRPGLTLTDRPEVNHPVISTEEIRAMLSTEPARIATLFERPL